MLFNYTQPEEKIKAAAYVRMSTEHQKYSPENQMAAIKEYADKHNYEIIKTYSDGGKSGLNISGRASLQQMLADVQGRQQQYKVILVLDVTRWGRFQDADESAYLEFMCKKAGVRVQYCAEQFTNDDSPVSTIIKSVKRTMAAEYSRELSGKVFAGQSRLITLGYKQGGPAGYGLRRMLIDEYGNHKGMLARGEHKSIATDRVILVPGPEEEQENVRWMYKAFVYDGKNEGAIADELNHRGIKTDLDKDWTKATVREVLSNEKYIGNNIFNRISYKLKIKRVQGLINCGADIKLNESQNLLNVNNMFTASLVNEAHYCRVLCDEIFGRKNFIADVIWNSRKSVSNDAIISLNTNHILVYTSCRSSNRALHSTSQKPPDQSYIRFLLHKPPPHQHLVHRQIPVYPQKPALFFYLQIHIHYQIHSHSPIHSVGD